LNKLLLSRFRRFHAVRREGGERPADDPARQRPSHRIPVAQRLEERYRQGVDVIKLFS
jgi:hypothetical protein